ncbi:MAG: type II toxin-antitoxin system VapC family toxin [Fimbriimonadaceae bacterium]|nr:type II toxin-antitoxin system VapC family toxin [Fimbriimonadaceae bacterium]
MTAPAVFVDAWGWVALAIQRDPAHRRASAWWAANTDHGGTLVTSPMVVAEAVTRIRYDFGWRQAAVLDEHVDILVDGGLVEMAYVGSTIWQDARAWFRRFDDQRFSMVECTSFAIMAARGIREALTADQHFATAGFVPLGAA